MYFEKLPSVQLYVDLVTAKSWILSLVTSQSKKFRQITEFTSSADKSKQTSKSSYAIRLFKGFSSWCASFGGSGASVPYLGPQVEVRGYIQPRKSVIWLWTSLILPVGFFEVYSPREASDWGVQDKYLHVHGPRALFYRAIGNVKCQLNFQFGNRFHNFLNLQN